MLIYFQGGASDSPLGLGWTADMAANWKGSGANEYTIALYIHVMRASKDALSVLNYSKIFISKDGAG